MSKTKYPVKTVGVFEIYPNLGKDTLKGKEISNGCAWMSFHCGTGTVTHKGKKVDITLSAALDGSTLLYANNRHVKVNVQKLIEEAIKAGWLDDKIDFVETKTS